jgi:hypothetical protein
MPKRTVPARGGAMPASGPTLEQWSSIDFKPWKRTKGDQPPTPARWRELWNPHGLNMRIAWEICHKTKPEITQIARDARQSEIWQGLHGELHVVHGVLKRHVQAA